jgi:hypothetical protein
MTGEPFWRTKTLAEMTPAEWESLCDGCGLCCLIRFEDEDTGEIIPTRVACRLFDDGACRCKDYASRKAVVPDCLKLTPGNVAELPWMPKSCAYRRLHEGRDLAWWHPLVSGDPESVHRAGVSVRGWTVPEESLECEEDAIDHAAPELLKERGRSRPPLLAGAAQRSPQASDRRLFGDLSEEGPKGREAPQLPGEGAKGRPALAPQEPRLRVVFTPRSRRGPR